MNNHMIVGVLLTTSFFSFCTLNAVVFQFFVANEFVSGNGIYLKLTTNVEGSDQKDGIVPFGETLTWSFSTLKYDVDILCKCWVDELVADSSTAYGYFEALNSKVIATYYVANSPDSEIMTLKWIVNEGGAALLNWKNQSYEMIFHWPMKSFAFYVTNDFVDREKMRLTVMKGRFKQKQQLVSSGSYMHWTHRYYVRGHENRVVYKCQVAEAPKPRRKIAVIIGSFEVFNLKWLKGPSKIETLEYRWRVNKDGAEKMDPKTGKYHLVHTWPLKSRKVSDGN